MVSNDKHLRDIIQQKFSPFDCPYTVHMRNTLSSITFFLFHDEVEGPPFDKGLLCPQLIFPVMRESIKGRTKT